MTVISLLTDFGISDEYVGVMKGVIWGIAPQAQLADITHEIQPQSVLQGALVLGRAYRFFPAGTVHLAVVDPGVGTSRRGIALRVGEQTFVGPDNGLFTIPLGLGESVEAVSLDNPVYQLPIVSRTFHGRDIFAPAAAHLANGVPLSAFGAPVTDPVRLNIPQPLRIGSTWQAEVLLVDAFGNLITNLPAADLTGGGDLEILCQGERISGLSITFGGHEAGSLIAIADSSGMLSLCAVNGNAAQRLDAGQGTKVVVRVR